MNGRDKCQMLRTLRRQIAKANNISFPSDECDYEGDDCPGTCPRCDMELRYLEMELSRRRQEGREVTIEPFTHEILSFLGVREPVSEEQLEQIPWYATEHRAPTEKLHLAMTKAGIVTMGDLLRANPNHLQEYFRLSEEEMDYLEHSLRKLGLAWPHRRRRRRDDGIRGMMRGPRG